MAIPNKKEASNQKFIKITDKAARLNERFLYLQFKNFKIKHLWSF